MHSRTDEELIRLMQAKERAAFEELYERYVKLVYSFARKAVTDEHAAREVVQAVFVRLWTTEAGYRAEGGKFVNWLLTVTRNAAIDHLRRQRNLPRTVPLDSAGWAPLEAASAETLPDVVTERESVRHQVRQACGFLTERQTRLIDMVYWQGYTLREAAESSGEPLGTVKNRLHQALKILRMHMPSGEEGWS